MTSIANNDIQRGALTPNAAPTDLSSMFGPAAYPFMSDVQRYLASRQQAEAQAKAQRDQALSPANGGVA